ncbi:TPA: N-6 DNA methylase, partial [Vibrio cholerae]|nr:N-6 DNA methylase [Vibrio cholerae]
KADFAFVLHMLHQLNDTGTMAVVLPHGVLFRGAAEGHIRQHLLKEKNYLDMVIGLPANIFFGTSIPTCVLVFKKNRQADDKVLFIDASQYYEKGTNNNQMREEDLQRILNAVTKRENIDKFAYLASQAELKENDYNLNIPRYVDTFEEDAAVNLAEVANLLVANDKAMLVTDKTIAEFCAELGIAAPFEVHSRA